jgi:hypothetical protein
MKVAYFSRNLRPEGRGKTAKNMASSQAEQKAKTIKTKY